MATITRAAIDRLNEEVETATSSAQAAVSRVLAVQSWEPGQVSECRARVVDALEVVMPAYTDVAAQAAADFYDAAREASTGSPMGARALSGYDPSLTERAVRAFVNEAIAGNVRRFDDLVLQRMGYEMRRAAGNSILENGMRDQLRPRFARVPGGTETCSFCVMLASRGFVYHTYESAGGLDHWHDNCKCVVVPGWDTYAAGPSRRSSASTEVEGYDPDELYDRYLDDMAAGRISPSVGVASSRNMRASSGRTFSSTEDMLRYVSDSRDSDELYKRVSEAYTAVDERYPRRAPREGSGRRARMSVAEASRRRARYLERLWQVARAAHAAMTASST